MEPRMVTRSLKKNLETIPGKHSIDSLQKTAILGTSHIIRKVLQCEAWSLSGGAHRWFKRSTGKKCLWQETYISYNKNNTSQSWEVKNSMMMIMIMTMMIIIIIIMRNGQMFPTALHKLFILTRRLNVALVRNLLLAFREELPVYIVQLQAAILLGLTDLWIWNRFLLPKCRSPNFPTQPHDSPNNKEAYCVAPWA